MQATTGSLRKVEVDKLVKTIKRGPLIIFFLTVIFGAVAYFSDLIHQSVDPAYRQQVLEFEQSQKRFDDSLKQIDNEHQ